MRYVMLFSRTAYRPIICREDGRVFGAKALTRSDGPDARVFSWMGKFEHEPTARIDFAADGVDAETITAKLVEARDVMFERVHHPEATAAQQIGLKLTQQALDLWRAGQAFSETVPAGH